MEEFIKVRGAREHNLKNISVDIPKNSLTVITGLSGSGKSSLAFDTIYAEGQRRYVESLSAYARQFLGLMNKPDVDSIDGLSPAISIDQKGVSKNPRSTVGTVTEIYDYLRLLYARIGIPHCPNCGKRIKSSSAGQITDYIVQNFSGKKIQVLAPIIRDKKGTHEKVFEEMKASGFSRARVDGDFIELEGYAPKLGRYEKHFIEAVVDRLKALEADKSRIQDAVETALKSGDGLTIILFEDDKVKKGWSEKLFSQKNACEDCAISLEEIQPRIFSFNSPFGACPECHGLGVKSEFDSDLIIPDKSKSILDGAIIPWQGFFKSFRMQALASVGKKFGFDLTTPLTKFTKKQLQVILYGTEEDIQFKYEAQSTNAKWEHEGGFEGVIPNLERRLRETKSEYQQEEIRKFMYNIKCPTCRGKRLKPESLAIKIGGKNIIESTDLDVENAIKFFSSLELSEKEKTISRQILKEIVARLKFLYNVGLGYITLSRVSSSLSGGEGQRIRLATQIGSGLAGVIYVLDEPSIGLHQKDNSKLLTTLKELRDLGNTLIVVEHDEETIRCADFVIDIGPGAGEHGGKIVALGTPKQVEQSRESITGAYLRGEKSVVAPSKTRTAKGFIELLGAGGNNLKAIDAKFPLGVLTTITGVSGSGKSTLVKETLEKILEQKFNKSKEKPLAYREVKGLEQVKAVIGVDQTPIGRTPRSNPATYIGVFTPIRELFSRTQVAKQKGFDAGRFSFNVSSGRCAECAGDGVIKIEMHFLPDVYVTCETCGGKRYDRETLSVKYNNKTIADVLDMSVEEALAFFENIPQIQRKLQAIYDVGLGYIKLGQPSNTLSGGEAQRTKLATELGKREEGRTLYILDEPTTGLHFDDVNKLVVALQRLVDRGNSVIVIEHNLDVIKASDWIIDLGPDGGNAGGQIIAQGTPKQVAGEKNSYTASYLRKVL